MKVVLDSHGKVFEYGKEHPFRCTKITIYNKMKEKSISPSGGDDSGPIQAAIDELSIPDLMRVGIERGWRLPWQPPVKTKVINPTAFLVANGTFNLGTTLFIPSGVGIMGGSFIYEKFKTGSSALRVDEDARNVVIRNVLLKEREFDLEEKSAG